jgi:hypothetical protein
MKTKNAAAVALGRKGGLKGGPARAAMLTPEQRSQSAKKAVTARWAKAKAKAGIARITATKKDLRSTNRKPVDRKRVKKTTPANIDASDKTLVNLLNRLRATVEPTEIRDLSDQIERVVFHKQFMNA